jgi:hypothetical protein
MDGKILNVTLLDHFIDVGPNVRVKVFVALCFVSLKSSHPGVALRRPRSGAADKQG